MAKPQVVTLPGFPPLADLPYELADDQDLAQVRERYNAMSPGDPDRPALRQRLATEYARRIDLGAGHPERRTAAYQHLLDLVGLWHTSELARGDTDALARFAPQARAIRATFARSGGDAETVAALHVLCLADPANRATYEAEIDEIFAYANALAVSVYGPGAEHARPVEILESSIIEAPMPAAVDRLGALYVTRQKSFDQFFRSSSSSSTRLLRVHGDGVFRTAWHIVRVLAHAGRIEQAPALLASLDGIGANRSIQDKLTAALAPDATEHAWIELADEYLDIRPKEPEESRNVKLHAALDILRTGARRVTTSSTLARRAGDAARQLGETALAIALHEDALARDPRNRDAADELADLYRMRISALAFHDRPLAAQERLEELEAFHARAAEQWPGKPLASDLAEAYAAMGRGMAGLGQLDQAERYLQTSIGLRPTYDALEQLGTIAFKKDRYGASIEQFERALKMPADTPLDLYNRAKILRLLADALAAAGMKQPAAEYWDDAIEAWMELDDRLELPPSLRAEALIEAGKAQWYLGDRETAMAAFDAAVDIDPDGADTHSAVVAFLIVRGQYQRALDVFHRALLSHDIIDYAKVYMSLWVVAEARRSGKPIDNLARDYLASREGRLWYDDLARFASGRADLKSLEDRARTRGRRAELLYYSAVLGGASGRQEIQARLRGVLATDMVLFFEYDMAKHWLAEGFAPQRRAAR